MGKEKEGKSYDRMTVLSKSSAAPRLNPPLRGTFRGLRPLSHQTNLPSGLLIPPEAPYALSDWPP